jgi:hypothetical protein
MFGRSPEPRPVGLSVTVLPQVAPAAGLIRYGGWY